ncbi:MAG: phosphate starvation-inducible protein PhoH [Dehalococcoidia bacterium]|jgi:phosphate starvation-inducible PhoH-like protein|nr:phosphate starvation-inducible protein PhoH [Dehalococcoidia bacterium]|tara:strand:- start:16329 stop:17060 length:732 start_codon:yes stop_codon:yes gene_type:complete
MGGRKCRREKLSPCSFETEYQEEQFDMDLEIPSMVPKNENQKKYNRVLYSNKPMIFATGPAGTGKTMLACYAAINGLNDDAYNKIILTRPTVSVEEDIGYLPGTLEEKMDPWTRPILDIFSEFYTQNQIQYMLKEKTIEICPLAYMRGRTFKNAYIIADEMQNSTPNQMKMLLTRIGENSKMVITGDLNQHDRKYEENGLKDIFEKLNNKTYKRIECITFDHEDIERSPIVKDILDIYGDLKK